MIKDIALGIIICLLFVSIVVLFCTIIIKLYIKKIKKYTAFIYEKEIEFQKTLNLSIIETQEQLFTAISQELHDDAGQQLTAINFQIENIKIDFPNFEPQIQPLSDSIGSLSKSVRDISHLLNNSFISKNNLFQTIKTELDRIKKHSKISVEYIVEEKPKKTFSQTEKIMIFRIFQESLNNILKHAKATKIKVNITEKPVFEIIITDNGIGFNPDEKTLHQSIGLENMHKRARMIDYSLTIQSEPQKGTTTTLTEIK
jgi:signal transduction histidine kinase